MKIQLKKIFHKLKNLSQRKTFRLSLLVAGILFFIFIIAINIIPLFNVQEKTVKETHLVTEQDKKAQAPFFETLAPRGKSIEQLGGWTRISPPDKNAVFAFVDSIENNRIVVGQQPLPEDFKEETDEQVAGLAKSYKSSEKVSVNGVTIHFATSAKGPQAVIFVKNNVLVNIRSSVTIDQTKWIDYVNSLE